MSEEPKETAATDGDDGNDGTREFEERLRQLLEESAYAIRPPSVPYPAIRRRGTVERRRRLAVAGAALATLTVLPVGAYAMTGGKGERGADLAAPPRPSAGAPRSPVPATTKAGPKEPAPPATDGQLLDGVTFAQATDGLRKCLVYNEQLNAGMKNPIAREDLGAAGEYRIILAMKATGDSNTPGDGYFVVAVRDTPAQTRLICTLKDGAASGLNVSSPDAAAGQTPVVADVNSGKLYQQSFLDRGNWKLPFRWAIIGTVEPSVARVTVSYGDSTVTAALDHGWFIGAGVLNRQVTAAPHLKGYDSAGKLVYDSDTDETYQKDLP